jgi:hypothetical protein
MNRLFGLLFALLLTSAAAFGQAQPVQQQGQDLKAATLTATATGAASTAVTATIGASSGQCLYITDIYIVLVANAAVTGAAGPAPIFTTTGLPTNLVWWGDNSTLTTGQMKPVTDKHYVNPLKVSSSTAFTIVTSGGQASQSVRINVAGYPANC